MRPATTCALILLLASLPGCEGRPRRSGAIDAIEAPDVASQDARDVDGQMSDGQAGDDATEAPTDTGNDVVAIPDSDIAPDTASPTPAPTVIDTGYGIDDDPDLLNPERGIYYWSVQQDDPHSLVAEWLYLGDVCDVELVWNGRGDPASSPPLEDLAAALEEHRAAARKVVFRPRYDVSGDDGLNACGVFQAQTEALTLRHVEAIAALLAEYRDVIAFVEAGYLGRWGEWNWSGYGPENAPILADPARRQAFLRAVIQAYRDAGLDRFVETRRPLFAHEVTEQFADVADGVGLYNDCFMTTESDMGTYSNMEPGNPYNFDTSDAARAYAEALTAAAPFGGETCPTADARWAECANMVGPSSEPASLHMSYLHGAWADTARAAWEAGGCYDEIKRRLGYRFEVRAVEYSPQVGSGELGTVRITLANTGWARLHNPRRATVVLRSDTHAYALGESVPPGYEASASGVQGDLVRDWLPGEESVLEGSFAGLAPGTYSVGLLVADPDRPELLGYAVRIASTRAGASLWDAQAGENDLGVEVVVL